jgi:hypothetical protein
MDKVRSYRNNTLYLDGILGLPVSKTYAQIIKYMLERRLFAGKELR